MAGYDFSDIRCLVVDDNEHMRRLLRTLLGSLGLRNVREAADGETGFKILADQLFDLVITDHAMEPLDGIEFTRRVRNANDTADETVPIIMLTGHTERDRVIRARDAGVTEFLAKPLTVDGLYRRIVAVIEKPRAFVQCAGFVGPDRRRRCEHNYRGELRRWDDLTDADDMVSL